LTKLQLFTIQETEGGVEYYDKALAINPKDETALDNKGAALDALGSYTGAIWETVLELYNIMIKHWS
jgi:tetratricopeptide (TPR) repeat protein